MTEYDYSPDALEQHVAKQARIARWVDDTNGHKPSNPFRPSSERSCHTSPGPSLVQSNPTISPAPISTHSSHSSRRHMSTSRHSRHHTHPIPTIQNSQLGLPLGGSLYMGATRAQLAQPMSLSLSAASVNQTASVPPQNQWLPYRTPSAVHLPVGSHDHQQYPTPSVSSRSQSVYRPNTNVPSVLSSPQSIYRANNVYSHPPSSPSVVPPFPQSAYRSNSVYGHPSPSVHSMPLPASSGSSVTYVQNPDQPVVVPLNGGGFVVVPAGQQVQVISPKE